MSKCPVSMRAELAPLPRHMRHLPVDDRGYPVPWFVEWVPGHWAGCDVLDLGPTLEPSTKPCNCGGRSVPEFRAMDPDKWTRAVKQRLCWVCGIELGVNFSFVAGPMCGINRTSSEPPCHIDCARWSAKNCPFLTKPLMARRQDELINNEGLREASSGLCLTRNPGVAMIWNTRSYEVFKVPPSFTTKGGVLITMGQADSVEWYCEGRVATRQEVLDSIEGGLPALEAMARSETGGIEELRKYQARFEKWLPQ